VAVKNEIETGSGSLKEKVAKELTKGKERNPK
jgi:hypothetical protein